VSAPQNHSPPSPPPLSESEAQRPFQLVRYYSVTSLAIILLFTLVVSTVLSHRAGELVLRSREQYALLLAENLNHQVMTRFVIPAIREFGGINVGQPAQFALLDAVVRNTIYSFKVRRVDILDLEGNVIYSTQPAYIARATFDTTLFAKALAGGHVSVLEPPREFFELGGGPPRVLKTMIPLRDERRLTAEMGPPRAVFEITLDISEDFRQVWGSQVIIICTLLAMMALLFLILRSIVIRGQRVMAQRAEMEARLKERLAQSERLAALGRMVAGVAHEIRNPLGIVRSTAELLGSRAAGEEDKALAQVIVDESSRLGKVVSEFLDFARPQRLSLAPVAVEETLERILEVMGPECTEAGVRVLKDFRARPARALADADQLYRALLNLVGNAMQAMRESGQDRPVLQVATRRQNRDERAWIVITISDNGPGFDPEVLDKVFDPFFTTREQGTGLGLSIVSNIVTSHQGRVRVGNLSRGGAWVEVWLPAATD